MVVIVNQTFARQFWPDEDPIGRRISAPNGAPIATVVGVVADVRQQLNQPPPPSCTCQC